MVQYTNECVGCSDLGLPCHGSSCPNRKVPHYYCDMCGEEITREPHYTDRMDLCEDCYDKMED